jgi:hypothetical protein
MISSGGSSAFIYYVFSQLPTLPDEDTIRKILAGLEKDYHSAIYHLLDTAPSQTFCELYPVLCSSGSLVNGIINPIEVRSWAMQADKLPLEIKKIADVAITRFLNRDSPNLTHH